MLQLEMEDWNALKTFAERHGVPGDRVNLVRRQQDADGRVGDKALSARPGSPYLFLIGRSKAGIELLIKQWLSAEVEKELTQANGKPLVIGPAPEQVQPRLGSWPVCKWKTLPRGVGHVLALVTEGRPAATIMAQIATLTTIDQLVLVTRIGQALHAGEREMVGAFSALAATARVLMVGSASEELTADDRNDLTAYAAAQMGQRGFATRYSGSAFWYASGAPAPGSMSTADLNRFLAVDPVAVGEGRAAMSRYALAALFKDLGDAVKKEGNASPQKRAPAQQEIDELSRQLVGYLAELEGELLTSIKTAPPDSSSTIQQRIIGTVHRWEAYLSPPGFWLERVEQLRPGTQAEFMHQVEEAAEVVRYDPGHPAASSAQPFGEQSFLRGRIGIEATRVGIALVIGIAANIVVSALMSGQPGVVTGLVAFAALLIGGVLGYGLARMLIKQPAAMQPVDPLASAVLYKPPSLQGWQEFEQRITAWFRSAMSSGEVSGGEELRKLAHRFGVLEEN